MSFENIQYQVHQGYAVLTLDRPQALNSFTQAMHEEIKQVIGQAGSDKEIRCLLITGAGRGFCAGQDLNDRAVSADDKAPDLGRSVENYYNPLIRAITSMQKPVICAVNGVAAGAGASIALACDIVLAAKSASFIQSFSKIGLVPDSGGSWNLPHALGLPRARGLALLGNKLSAEQAESWGMIWQCLDDGELMPEALKMAGHLARQPILGLAATKALMNTSFSRSLNEQLELEKNEMRRLGNTSDYREGVSAFVEKRKPVFTGS